MLPLVLGELVEEVKWVLRSPPLKWRQFKPSQADIALFQTEANMESQFDPLKLKRTMWTNYMNGKAIMTCVECDYAQVFAILPTSAEIPTESWGRIFQWMGPPPSGKWRVFWLGATARRQFPSHGPLAAEHLNGGYTNPCSTRGIFIYRQEEATRVLIHELLHAGCLDPRGATLSVKEATVEAWAELFLVALRSKGLPAQAARLWALQAQWIADTNQRAAKNHNVRGNSQYGWRYLNGREQVFLGLGIVLPQAKGPTPTSSRFTHPALGD